MSNNKESKIAAHGGIGATTLLTIVFIVLKLCNVIHWSWVWILSPTWIPIAISILIAIVIFIVVFLKTIKSKNENKTK